MNEFLSRQIKFIGKENQEKLSRAKVTVVGCGSLGSFVISALVRSGVGSIKIIDRDFVEKPNLYANETFELHHIGQPKAFVMKNMMEKVNKSCKIDARVENLDFDNVDLLKNSEIVVDCTDNIAARYLINDYCVKNKIPWIHGAVVMDQGYVIPIKAGGKPCFRCVFGDNKRPETTCDISGVLASIVFITASLQVYEVIKFYTNIGISTFGQIIHVRLGEKDSEIINVKPHPKCSACGTGHFPALSKNSYTSVSICGNDSYQFKPKKKYKINFSEITTKMKKAGLKAENVKDMMIRIEHKRSKASLFKNGTAIIKSESKKKAEKLFKSILLVLDS